MPTLLHLREKAIVYAMRCLLETLKLLFKNRALASALFAQLSVFSTCTKHFKNGMKNKMHLQLAYMDL